MKSFVVGEARDQSMLFPALLDDFIADDNPVRAIEAFVDGLDLKDMCFRGVDPHANGRPAYHPAVLLKLYIYGYLNRIQSSRRLEREPQRNFELMWLTELLTPDFKKVADFRKNNGEVIRGVCRELILLSAYGVLTSCSRRNGAIVLQVPKLRRSSRHDVYELRGKREGYMVTRSGR